MARRGSRGPFGGGRELGGRVGRENEVGRRATELAAKVEAFGRARVARDLVQAALVELTALLYSKDQKVGELLDLRTRSALGRAEQGLLERLVTAQVMVVELGVRAVGADDLLDALPSAGPPEIIESAGPASHPETAAGAEGPGGDADGSATSSSANDREGPQTPRDGAFPGLGATISSGSMPEARVAGKPPHIEACDLAMGEE